MADDRQAMKTLLCASEKFQKRFTDSVKGRETNTIRLSIKLVKGRVTDIKLNMDEDIPVPLDIQSEKDKD